MVPGATVPDVTVSKSHALIESDTVAPKMVNLSVCICV